jgi:hypothetical protein
MKSAKYLLAAALAVGVSGTAMAQSVAPSVSGPTPSVAPPNDVGAVRTHWTASGFVGSNFGTSGSAISVDNRRSIGFGGEVAYLWRGIVGAEFLTDFTPSFGVNGPSTNSNDPHVNSYMGNAIAVVPIGGNGQFQPYASGGYGGITMRFPNAITTATPVSTTSTSPGTQSGGGSNVGGGLMAYGGKVGIRADVRYYHAATSTTRSGSDADQVTQALLSGLGFWRTNVGVAFQW